LRGALVIIQAILVEVEVEEAGVEGMLHQQQGCRPSGRYDVWVNGCQTMRDSRIIMKNCIL